MRMKTEVIFALFAAGLVFGQPCMEITEAERVDIGEPDPVPAILDRLSQLKLGPLSGAAAKSMLAASVAGSQHFLRWHLEKLTGATTLIDNETGILVAHWASTGIDIARHRRLALGRSDRLLFPSPISLGNNE